MISSRTERRAASSGLKEIVSELPTRQGVFRLIKPLTGANNSTQYVAVVGYTSRISGQEETIKVEVGLREPLLTPVASGEARTLLLDPIRGENMVPVLSVPCISFPEAMAEKLRAALSRREAAIRDFYDIDYAVQKLDFHPLGKKVTELVRAKLAVPGNDSVDLSGKRLAILRQQLDTQLKPVLRTRDFADFDLARAFKIALAMAATIEADVTEG